MPRVEYYEYVNPWETPEPHLLPGYTGYVPGCGPKRILKMAKQYGQMTNELMLADPVAGYRLAPIADTTETSNKQKEQDHYVRKHESQANNLKLRYTMIPGYTGYIPRKLFFYGKNYAPECRDATADFQKHLDKINDYLRKNFTQEERIITEIPEELKFPLLEGDDTGKHFRVPTYSPYYNNTETDPSLFRVNLNIKEMCKAELSGAETDPDPAHDWYDYTVANLERQLLRNQRPKADDWFANAKRQASEKIRLDGFNQQATKFWIPAAHVTEPGFTAQRFLLRSDNLFFDSLKPNSK